MANFPTVIYDTLIIGAGAAGLMAASHLRGLSVALLDSNQKIGAKLAVSGGGRCNITNAALSSAHYDGDSAFIQPLLSRFGREELLDFLRKERVVPELRPSLVPGQYFCGSSQEMIDLFRRTTRHAEFHLGEPVRAVEFGSDRLFQVSTAQRTFRARTLLLATGGPSYPQLGASDLGHRIARQFGHTVSRLDPALVGWTLLPEQRWFTSLSGLSTEVVLNVEHHVIRGKVLFAHRGLTGPAAMNGSLRWRRGAITIDWLPDLTVESLRRSRSNRLLSASLPLPKRLARALLLAHGINDIPLSTLRPEDLSALRRLKSDSFSPAGTFGLNRAEVTRGGVSTDQVDPLTLESRLVPGLYLLGELLDVTGELGGYNLHWALATGALCGRALQEKQAP